MEGKEKLLNKIGKWSNEFTNVKNMFHLYESIFSASTLEEKEIKESVGRKYKHFFSFSRKAYLDSIILNLEKFFQKNSKKYNSYYSIKKEAEKIQPIDFTQIEEKYNKIRESVNKIGNYRNHEIAHFQKKKKENNHLHTNDIKELIDFILEFLNFILLEIFKNENDFGEYLIKESLEKEIIEIFKVLDKEYTSANPNNEEITNELLEKLWK